MRKMSYRMKVYKIVAALFLCAVILSSVFIIHFALARATIIVSSRETPLFSKKDFSLHLQRQKSEAEPAPSLEDLSQEIKAFELSFSKNKGASTQESVAPYDFVGELIEIQSKGEKKFKPTALGKSIEGFAQGIVTIINDSNYDQTLVKTTRLLTPDNVLFRIQKLVVVPKKGSVTVLAVADKKGASGDVGEGVLRIPGLSASAQKLIYAQREKPFVGGVYSSAVVTKPDITNAEIALVEELENKGLVSMHAKNSNITLKDVVPEIISLSASAKEGDGVDEFLVSGELVLRAINFDKKALLERMKQQMQGELKQNEMVLRYDEQSFDYEITSLPGDENKAVVTASLKAFGTITTDNMDKVKTLLAGNGASAVQSYFLKNPNISAVSVRFWPFWVHTVPRFSDHVNIIIVGEDEAVK